MKEMKEEKQKWLVTYDSAGRWYLEMNYIYKCLWVFEIGRGEDFSLGQICHGFFVLGKLGTGEG